MEYLLLILVGVNLFAGLLFYYRLLHQLKKRNKSIESQLHRVNNWVVLNNQTIVQDLEKIKETVTSLHRGGKIIEMNRQEQSAGITTTAIEKEETNIFHNIHHSFMSLPYQNEMPSTRQEGEPHYFYLAILEELQRINKTIHISQQRHKPGRINTGQTAFNHKEDNTVLNGWNHRINKRI